MVRTGPRSVWVALLLTSILLGALAAPASANGLSRQRPSPRIPGMVLVESNRSFDETWSTLIGALEANPNISLVATVDHGAAAASVGLDLEPNRVAIFGNPNLGTPLMQLNQVTGLDLPQKIQVFIDRDRVWVGFNDASYLRVRHDLGNQPTLETIAGALRSLAGVAADNDVEGAGRFLRRLGKRPGLLQATSDADVDTTWNRLLAAIEASPANVAFTVDHQANAASVDLDLRPTRLVAFGNPNLGTPLMQARPTAGIDLPIKFLVWEDEDGRTQVTTNDPRFIQFRHRASGVDLDPIAGAVDNFLAIATSSN